MMICFSHYFAPNHFDKDTLCLMTVKKLVTNINLTLLFEGVILLIKAILSFFEQFYALCVYYLLSIKINFFLA
jgi:hypothetical protein